LLHILWFILALKILVCDFRNLTIFIKKAIKMYEFLRQTHDDYQ